ncbi:hypothetical protein GCM10009788_10020 [Nocardioides humi]|uniref:Uncharacterized protein n=2 Tax=Nocardioides humi TaxID=449461 RepID=A0ABN2A0H6_9ACTN
MFRVGQVVRTMNRSALALDRIADDFAETDAEAARWLDQHRSWLDRNGYGGEPERAPVPRTPEA